MAGALVAALVAAAGCASAPPPPPPPSARPFADVRTLGIVASGESALSVLDLSAEPGRTFDQILAWYPAKPWLRPLAKVVHQGINWALSIDQTASIAKSVDDVSPRAVVAAALARRLAASGWFESVRVLDREGTAGERRRDEAIVRVTVPAWGLVRVRDGAPDLLAGFADVTGQMMLAGTGVLVWESSQDVTAAEPFPLDSFTSDRAFTRQALLDVLDRAGQRLASELMYARSAGR